MARCGIRYRYPVRLLMLDDAARDQVGPEIGDAETIKEARELAEQQGYMIREEGGSRFAGADSGFLICVYPR